MSRFAFDSLISAADWLSRPDYSLRAAHDYHPYGPDNQKRSSEISAPENCASHSFLACYVAKQTYVSGSTDIYHYARRVLRI